MNLNAAKYQTQPIEKCIREIEIYPHNLEMVPSSENGDLSFIKANIRLSSELF